jgi:hypothetical protein
MGIDFHNAISSFEGGLNRANRHTVRILAMITKHWKESLVCLRKLSSFDKVAPCSPHAQWYPIFHFTGDKTAVTPGAFPKINDHRIPDLFQRLY